MSLDLERMSNDALAEMVITDPYGDGYQPNGLEETLAQAQIRRARVLLVKRLGTAGADALEAGVRRGYERQDGGGMAR